MKLEAAVSGNRITIAGRIDDTARLHGLASQVPAGEVVIDTSGVTFVNSVGMREWIRLLRALRDAGRSIRLERVADVLMTQMNLISELRGVVAISSFHAQYVCPKCGAEAAPVVDATLPAVACPECGSAMELGDFPERYLTIFKG